MANIRNEAETKELHRKIDFETVAKNAVESVFNELEIKANK